MYSFAPWYPDPPTADGKEGSPGHSRLSQGRVGATGDPAVVPATNLPCSPLGSESQLILTFFFLFLASPVHKTETGPNFPKQPFPATVVPSWDNPCLIFTSFHPPGKHSLPLGARDSYSWTVQH